MFAGREDEEGVTVNRGEIRRDQEGMREGGENKREGKRRRKEEERTVRIKWPRKKVKGEGGIKKTAEQIIRMKGCLEYQNNACKIIYCYLYC